LPLVGGTLSAVARRCAYLTDNAPSRALPL